MHRTQPIPFRRRAELIVALVVVVASCLLETAAAQPESRPRDGFRLAEPGFTFRFPRDHGSHDEFQTEWWYFNGHLFTPAGRSYGFELVFFRVGVEIEGSPAEGAWNLEHLALAHFALTDVDRKEFRYAEKLNRMTPYLAGAGTSHLRLFNEGWSATSATDGSIRLRASSGGDEIDLVLRSRKPPAIHGIDGVSVKAEGRGSASHYYSLTRLELEGMVTSGGTRERCTGLAWMDHEFGSAVLRESQVGWDWFSIQLDNRTELMLYQIRRRDGSPDVTSAGSYILDDGSVVHLDHTQYEIHASGRWRSPHSGALYPMGWHIRVPQLDLELTVEPRLRDQELITSRSTRVTYWEGAATVSGRAGTAAVSGLGYVEMTGYDRPFR